MKRSSWMFAVALLAVVVCGAVMISYAQQTDNSAAPAWSGHRHGGHMGYWPKS